MIDKPTLPTGIDKLAGTLARRLDQVPLIYKWGVSGDATSVTENIVAVVLAHNGGELLMFQMTVEAAERLRDQLTDTLERDT